MNFEILKQICDTPGAPGDEKKIRDLIISLIEPYVDRYYIDNIGNLIAVKEGSSGDTKKKLMLAAHMDEIGFMVTHIDDNGFIRFIPLGGFDPKTLSSLRVIIHGKQDIPGVMGSKPIHAMTMEERGKNIAIQDFFIDTGLDKQTLERIVQPGDSITRSQELIRFGNLINGKSLDNRLCVYILIEALQAINKQNLPYDLYAVFTVQEEVGLRGAHVSAHGINPDYGIALDVTIANDIPGISAHEQVTRLGHGAAIKLYDAGTICDKRMVGYLKTCAKNHDIRHQYEILPAGGTDTAGIQRMAQDGAIAGAISVPMRYLHQTIESAHEQDVDDVIQLLTKAMTEIHLFDWRP